MKRLAKTADSSNINITHQMQNADGLGLEVDEWVEGPSGNSKVTGSTLSSPSLRVEEYLSKTLNTPPCTHLSHLSSHLLGETVTPHQH